MKVLLILEENSWKIEISLELVSDILRVIVGSKMKHLNRHHDCHAIWIRVTHETHNDNKT